MSEPLDKNTVVPAPRVVIDLESAKKMRDSMYHARLQSLRAAQHALEAAKILDVVHRIPHLLRAL